MAKQRAAAPHTTLSAVGADAVLERDAQRVSGAQAEGVLAREGELRELARKGKLRAAFDDVVTMLAMVRDYVRGDYRKMPWSTITAIVAALLYVLNPFDFVADALPVLGQLDDAAVIAACLKLVRKDIARYRAHRALPTP